MPDLVERETKPLMGFQSRLGHCANWLTELVFGPPLPEKLPERVRNIIRQQQETSEIVISFAQIGAIIFFAVFYAVSPKAFPDTVPFEPVPVTLGVYGLFTLWRTKKALQRELTPIILTTSVVIDIIVLMLTIWSFHLQYQSPPEMYLKAPTVMYVFIMIALRALRFEPFYVIIAGVSGMLGWSVLVLYAILHGDDSMVTRSFATYVTSHSVLIGAEIDKLISMGSVTGILALALYRARKILFRAALDGQAAADLSRFFAPEVAGRIKGTDQEIEPGMAEERAAAIMFIDLRGFTPITSQLPPADVMRLLSDYQDLAIEAVGKNHGSIDKFMGDGILASFGATQPSTAYAANAARSIELIIEKGRAWRDQRQQAGLLAPEIAAAMTTGTVMFGAVGSHDRLEYTVIGDAVNLAAKLEKHCKIEQTPALMPLSAMEIARGQGFVPAMSWQSCPRRNVAGVPQPIDLMSI